MKVCLDLNDTLATRLRACADKRGVSPEALAFAYVEDWLSIEYAEMKGRNSRRSIYRDGPIAFDPEAAKAAALIERDIQSGTEGLL